MNDYDEALLKEIKRRTQNLANLFEDPEPGLAHWVMMVAEEMDFLVSWWEGKFSDHDFRTGEAKR